MKMMIRMVIACSALAFSCWTPAQAADPGFCRNYAHAAVEQFERAMSNPFCASRVGGPRWSPNYEAHFGWCVAAPPGNVQHEWDARSRMLFRCTRGI